MDREKVLAYRAAGHHLDRRLGSDGLLPAVGAIGLRDQQGSALVALHARVAGVSRDALDAALADCAVVEVASVRGVFMLVSAADVDVFTLGTLPADEASLRHRLRPLGAGLDASGFSATDALARAVDVARDALTAGPLDIGGLSGALTRALPELSPMCRGRCGVEHIDQGLFDLVGEAGTWRREEDDGARLFVALPEPSTPRAEARRELVRRYLACHGPSTVQQFADWCGISAADARGSLAGDDETTEVERGAYVLARDLDRFEAAAPVQGVRMLPPRDPYLEGRDRSALVPDRAIQKTIWRAIPTVGVVLVDGDAAGAWRTAKAGKKLQLLVELFGDEVSGMEEEAQAVAALRGCDAVRLGLTMS